MGVSPETLKAARAAAAKLDSDVYFFNGRIAGIRDLRFVECVFAGKRDALKARKTARLFLTTNGGEPDAAYKMARYLQEKYDEYTLIISGRCKSAGTLVAIGAHEIAYTPFGELGPLDIQLAKVDKFDELQSGLSIQDALNTLEERAVAKYHEIAKGWIEANQGLVSFAAATKAAAEVVAQLYCPIFGRIDPEEVGARTRSMRIATDYGQRLAVKSKNLQKGTLSTLAETYSSHSFVIDQREAAQLFLRVRAATDAEKSVVDALGGYARYQVPAKAEYDCFTLHALKTVRESAKKSSNQSATGRRNGHAQTKPARRRSANGGNSAGAETPTSVAAGTLPRRRRQHPSAHTGQNGSPRTRAA